VSVLIRGVTSLKRDNLVVFYYICISVHQKSGLISGGGDFGELSGQISDVLIYKCSKTL
jgi:hypothetical protein